MKPLTPLPKGMITLAEFINSLPKAKIIEIKADKPFKIDHHWNHFDQPLESLTKHY
jgi:hypothetical protein